VAAAAAAADAEAAVEGCATVGLEPRRAVLNLTRDDNAIGFMRPVTRPSRSDFRHLGL